MAAREASGRIPVPGGQAWYRITGGGPGIPLLLLHGGPGFPSHYLEPLAALGDERPVVFYDQLGCGRSDRPVDPGLWRIERFVEEVAAVRSALGLSRVILHGHSWGGALAVETVLSGAGGVEGVVLASPILDAGRWLADADRLRRELPADVQETLRRHEAAGTTGSPAYEQATEVFYRAFVCRRDPWPDEMQASLAGLGRDCYLAMWTLFTVGRFDEATPASVAAFRDLVPGSGMAVLEGSAHMTMLDEPDAYRALLRRFLREVDRRGAGGSQGPAILS